MMSTHTVKLRILDVSETLPIFRPSMLVSAYQYPPDPPDTSDHHDAPDTSDHPDPRDLHDHPDARDAHDSRDARDLPHNHHGIGIIHLRKEHPVYDSAPL